MASFSLHENAPPVILMIHAGAISHAYVGSASVLVGDIDDALDSEKGNVLHITNWFKYYLSFWPCSYRNIATIVSASCIASNNLLCAVVEELLSHFVEELLSAEHRVMKIEPHRGEYKLYILHFLKFSS